MGGLLVGSASPAMAAQLCQAASSPTYAAWSTSTEYDYGRGGWCMHQSADPTYRMVFQDDGNFVIYHSSVNDPGAVTWSSGTSGTELAFQKDGNVVIYNGGQAQWETRTYGSALGHPNGWPSGTAFRLYIESPGVWEFQAIAPAGAVQSVLLKR